MSAFTFLQKNDLCKVQPTDECKSFCCNSLDDLKKMFLDIFSVFPSEVCVITELEDLSASVDVQDVYTKIKCKVGSFNIDHYRCR